MMAKKLTIVGWVIEAELSDGRIVALDIGDDVAQEVDDELSWMQENDEIEDYIIKTRGKQDGKEEESKSK